MQLRIYTKTFSCSAATTPACKLQVMLLLYDEGNRMAKTGTQYFFVRGSVFWTIQLIFYECFWNLFETVLWYIYKCFQLQSNEWHCSFMACVLTNKYFSKEVRYLMFINLSSVSCISFLCCRNVIFIFFSFIKKCLPSMSCIFSPMVLNVCIFKRYYTEVRNFSIVTTLLLATHICLLIPKA